MDTSDASRARRLHLAAQGQLDAVAAALTTSDAAALERPCPGRERLGDGSIGAVAQHVIDRWLDIAGFATAGDSTHSHADMTHAQDRSVPSRGALLARIELVDSAITVLGHLSDAQLDAPVPAGAMRFGDGERTLEQVLVAVIKHQQHQVDAVSAALANVGD